MQYSLNKDHQHHKCSTKSHGYHLQIARLRKTSCRRSICFFPSKNGRCSQIIENSQIGMSRHFDSSTTTQVAKIMVQYGRPSRSSRKESTRSSCGKTAVGKAIWENPIAARLAKGFQLEMLIRTPSKELFLSVYVYDIKLAGKKQNIWSDVEITQQRSWFGRTNIFPWSCILGMHSKTMWNKQRYCGQLHNHVWIANFRGRNRKASILWEFSYFFMVLWHGWSCKKVCGATLWVIKQDD